MNAIPLSLYVHFPWCVRKCPYCDFNSHEIGTGDLPEATYIDALIQDLANEAADERRAELVSIFMGGGTPSLFSPTAIDHLLTCVADRFNLSAAEITLETNPGTFDQSHFDGYRSAGVNRISIGAQSFSNDSLKALGRIHESDEIARAFKGARAAGFERINLDLMHGLPGQTTAQALDDLDRAIELGPEHISWYQLTIEPNTVFNRFPPELPMEDTLAEIFEAGCARLVAAGFEQYEVSAWAKPLEASHHNLNYWQFGDYLGIGAGAHGKLTREDGVYRTTRTRVPKDYLARTGESTDRKRVDQSELVLEFLMNALRLNAGFELALFEERTGLEPHALDAFIQGAVDRHFVTADQDIVVPTETGRRFLNEMLVLV